MTAKTRTELAALIPEGASPGQIVAPAMGYDPAPEPPQYPVGTIAWTRKGAQCWMLRSLRSDDTWNVCDDTGCDSGFNAVTPSECVEFQIRPLHTYDPAIQMVIPLDKVPSSSELNEGRIVADNCTLRGVARFLNEVRSLALEAREAGK